MVAAAPFEEAAVDSVVLVVAVLVEEVQTSHMPGQVVVDVMEVMVLIHVARMQKVGDLVIKELLPPTHRLTQKHCTLLVGNRIITVVMVKL